MLNTIATLVTGALLASSAVQISPIQETAQYSAYTLAEGLSEVSYSISVKSTTEELEDIKAAAEEAGMGFTYKKRGVKTRLVIDMVIETKEDYTMERMVIREEDGTQTIAWSVDEKGQAIAFIKEDKVDLTEYSR